MRTALVLLAAVSAVSFATLDVAEARTNKKKRGEVVVKVKPRSFLDGGTSVLPGTYQGYSLGMTPHRAGEFMSPTTGAQERLLPGRFGP